MNTHDIEQERQKFEAFMREKNPSHDLEHEFGIYRFSPVQRHWDTWQAAIEAALQSQYREALTILLDACPTTLHCDDFHHTKADQHMDGEYCPPLARYLAAIDLARRVEEES